MESHYLAQGAVDSGRAGQPAQGMLRSQTHAHAPAISFPKSLMSFQVAVGNQPPTRVKDINVLSVGGMDKYSLYYFFIITITFLGYV
jgi:hypothetical protein